MFYKKLTLSFFVLVCFVVIDFKTLIAEKLTANFDYEHGKFLYYKDSILQAEANIKGYEENTPHGICVRYEVKYFLLDITTEVMCSPLDVLLEETLPEKWKIKYEYDPTRIDWPATYTYTIFGYDKKAKDYSLILKKLIKEKYEPREGNFYYKTQGENKTITHFVYEFEIKSAVFPMHLLKQIKIIPKY